MEFFADILIDNEIGGVGLEVSVKIRLLERSDRARRPAELENVHACMCAVDDVDVAALVDFDIIGLNHAPTALRAGVTDLRRTFNHHRRPCRRFRCRRPRVPRLMGI